MMTAGGFTVDTTLGTLATCLRLIEYETRYDPESSPEEMITINWRLMVRR